MHTTPTHPEISFDHGTAWWYELGLTAGIGLRDRALIESVLRQYEPVGFRSITGEDGDSAPGTAAITVSGIAEAIVAAEIKAKRAREKARATRHLENTSEFEAALASADAGVLVTEGRWAGFTVGEARAWCFNLFEFEAVGAAQPKVQLRFESLAKLRAGELPEVFGYPERARQLHDTGLSPREYRRIREALSARPANVGGEN